MGQTINANILDRPLYWHLATLQPRDALWSPCHGVYASESGLTAQQKSSRQAPGDLWSCIRALSTGSGALALFSLLLLAERKDDRLLVPQITFSNRQTLRKKKSHCLY